MSVCANVCLHLWRKTKQKNNILIRQEENRKKRMATNKLLLFLPLSFDYYSFRNGYSSSVFRLATVVVVVVAAVVAIFVVAIVQHFK